MPTPEMNRRVNQLRHDVDDFYDLLTETNKTVKTIAVEQHQHGKRLDEIQAAQDHAVGRLDRLEQGQQEHSAKIDALDTKFSALDSKVGSLDSKVGSLDTKFSALDTKVSSLDSKMDQVLALLSDRPSGE